jgi:hypothetical protein
MSSAAGRIGMALGRVLRALVWLTVLVVLAASGAGLVGQSWHPPGSAARAELTYVGDAAMDARLDAATGRLARIGDAVATLAEEAKTALEEVTSSDLTRLRDSLQRGGAAAAELELEASELRAELADLPGGDANAGIWFANATLVRRSAVVAAAEAAVSIADHWQVVAARSGEAANLSALLALHDETVVAAAARGRRSEYPAAITMLNDALATVTAIQELRTRLIAGSGGTVLDEWIQRNAAYDTALRALYQALIDSGGTVTNAVQAARRAERAAFEQLPPDRRTIIVILSEVTRGDLTEAVLAIEDAHGQIEDALAEAPA